MASNANQTASRLRSLGSPHGLLLVICAAHLLLVGIFVVTHHMWWEQDETVYLSQVAAHHPAMYFSPPRARGMPVLLYPVVHFTTRLSIIRSYVGVLGTAALYLGFRPWLRLGFGRVVALAALLFSTLWAATFFGAETQPNFLVAALSLASVGYAIVAIRAGAGRRGLFPVVGSTALIALIRPSDATWLCAALLLAMLGLRAWPQRRRRIVAVALLSGLALGWSEWVIESFVSYGGFFDRLHAANAVNTPGLHFSLPAQAAAVNGPTLCRPCAQAISLPHIAWWIAIPPLIVVGLAAARGTRRFRPLVLATVAGTAMLGEYVLTISYAAPRFLLPAYAFYALPCAAGIAALAAWRPRPAFRVVVPAVVIGFLLVQVVSQTNYLHRLVGHYTKSRGRYLVEAARLHRAGVHPPCVINGPFGTPVAFQLGCNDHPNPQQGVLARVARGTTVVVFTRAGVNPYPHSRRVRLSRRARVGHEVARVLPGRQSPAPPPTPTSSQPAHR